MQVRRDVSHNVWRTGKCGATDVAAAGLEGQFVDLGGHDWPLKAGAAAINAADPATAPATDRDGLTRNGPPDAGAHEYQGGSTPPPDTQAPSVPQNVAATGGVNKVTLGWSPSSDNRACRPMTSTAQRRPASALERERVAAVTARASTTACLPPATTTTSSPRRTRRTT